MSQNPNFLGKCKTPTFIRVNSFTSLVVDSGISQVHQARSGFSNLGAIPLTT